MEDDQSILRGCGSLRTNLGLLRAVREDEPSAFIVYKPHPDVAAGNRTGAVPASALRELADAVVTGTDIAACYGAVDALATLTSLSGFEALLRGLPVTTYGMPFYAGWGLTSDRLPSPRRTRRLSLDALVAGALITYPIYVDPGSGLPCAPEYLVSLLAARAGAPGPLRLRWLRGLAEMLRPSAPPLY